ncbi:MAG: hypothetical protein H0T89_04185 [Deltaproteobacteria bacterium]|nr:hypothetical protein [Deltaproteobacteria bacterium]MDQ3297245.1 hypothetical protein [Myxococcota bacterium]
MRPIRVGRLIIMIILVGCEEQQSPPLAIEAGVDASLCPGVRTSLCSPLTQSGCPVGNRCTWIIDRPDTGLGHIGCAPIGPHTIGASCAYSPVPGCEQMMVDDCGRGLACAGGTCKAICDHMGGQPMCAAGNCVVVEDLFVIADMTRAGVCDVSAARSR